MIQLDDFLQNNQKEYNNLKELQELIVDDELENCEKIIDFLKSSSFFGTREKMLDLLNSFKQAIIIRPRLLNIYISLLSYIISENNHFDNEELLDFFNRNTEKTNNFVYGNLRIVRDKLEKIIKGNNDEKNDEKINDIDQQIMDSIINDDVDNLQDIISKTNIDINMQLKSEKFEIFRIEYKEAPSLIEAAALWGSISVFKFMYMNEAKITSKLLEYAVAGGNSEIVHSVENMHLPFDLSVANSIAIRYWRNDISLYFHSLYLSTIQLSPDILQSSSKDIFISLYICYEQLYSSVYGFNIALFFDNLSNLNQVYQSKYKELKLNNVSEYNRLYDAFSHEKFLLFSKYNENSYLHIAAIHNFLSIAKILLTIDFKDYGIFFEVNNHDNQYSGTPFYFAVSGNSYDTVKYMLSTDNPNYNSININDFDSQYTPLMTAGIMHFDKIVEVLCSDERLNPNISTLITQFTALHLSIGITYHDDPPEICKKISNIVRSLLSLKQRIDIRKQTSKNITALHLAVFQDNIDVIKQLVEADPALISIGNNTATMPLTYALQKPCKHETFEYLCSLPNIDVNTKNKFGVTPLHLAVQLRDTTYLKILLKHPNIDVNIKNGDDNYGDLQNTPLHIAASGDFIESLIILLEDKRVDINALNSNDNTPFYLAACNGNLKCLELLSQNPGIVTGMVNKAGVSILKFMKQPYMLLLAILI